MEHTERDERLYNEGVKLLKEHGAVSCIFLQQELLIGYAAARNIIDRMLEEKVAVSGIDSEVVSNEQRERMVKRDSFNGMTVKDFLERIIEKEREFDEIDYKALSFEERCEYVLAFGQRSYPFAAKISYADGMDLKFDIIVKSLDVDAAGNYYLAKFANKIGISPKSKMDSLKLASDMGYMPATVLYQTLCYDADERYRIARALVNEIPSIEPLYLRCKAIIGCYSTLRRVEGEDKYPHHYDLAYDLFLQLARDGDYSAFAQLEAISRYRALTAQTEEEKRCAKKECAFWQTVQYTVREHYYSKGELKHEEYLGYMLSRGIGCDVDLERGAELTIKDMKRTLKELDSDVKDRAVASLRCDNKTSGSLENRIAVAVLQNDGSELEACIEAAKENGILADVLNEASRVFFKRIRKAKKGGKK